MGNNKIRRFMHENKKWTDKSAKRHKHDFSQQGIIHVYEVDESKHIAHTYYLANICKYCNSFIDAKFLTNDKYDILYTLPHRRYVKPHFAFTFVDMQYVDNKVEIKN